MPIFYKNLARVSRRTKKKFIVSNQVLISFYCLCTSKQVVSHLILKTLMESQWSLRLKNNIVTIVLLMKIKQKLHHPNLLSPLELESEQIKDKTLCIEYILKTQSINKCFINKRRGTKKNEIWVKIMYVTN